MFREIREVRKNEKNLTLRNTHKDSTWDPDERVRPDFWTSPKNKKEEQIPWDPDSRI